MIYLLEQADYHTVRPLFAELAEWNFVIDSVLDGIVPGRIYVDDPAHPESAFFFSAFWYFLAGNPDHQAFNQAIHTLITSESFADDPHRGEKDMVFLVCQPDSWQGQFPVLFKEQMPTEIGRYRHLFTQLPIGWQEGLPDGFTVRRFDQELLENKQRRNFDGLDHWMHMYWGAPTETFLREGVGVCLMHEDAIASWCLTVNVAGDRCELGIETAQEYRLQGLGAFTAMATVDCCLKRGFTTIDWHCGDDHMGSRGVARKAGFVKEREYTAYLYMLDPVSHYAFPGDLRLRGRRYQEAVALYEKALTIGEASDAVHHNMARAYAMLGDPDKAFCHLNNAIDKGWAKLEFTKGCEEFQSLRSTPGWEAALVRLEQQS
jgi:RimJ/RimL family protein N-acetyltransferase